MGELINYNRHNNLYDVPEAEFDNYVARRGEAVAKGTTLVSEMRLRDGRVIKYQVMALPDGGRMLTYFDITELRRRAEQVEAQSEELAKLNQELEQRVSDQVGEIERMGRLRRFLPPQVADLIVASGAEKQLESHRREITALFCDLRGFTGFSESADPEDVMALLREYHAAIGDSIVKYNGTLERYAGDGVMVVFNDPVPVENPALQAVLMALEMRDAIASLDRNMALDGGTTLASASASHTGLPRSALSALRDASIMPPSGQCPTSPLACAMKRSRGKS